MVKTCVQTGAVGNPRQSDGRARTESSAECLRPAKARPFDEELALLPARAARCAQSVEHRALGLRDRDGRRAPTIAVASAEEAGRLLPIVMAFIVTAYIVMAYMPADRLYSNGLCACR